MSFVDALAFIEDDQPHSPAMQMAIDEALLHHAATPTLRVYRWRAPAVSFGYFSRFCDVRPFSGDRELVRRWTGGGIVMHDNDLTYSFVVPALHPLYAVSSHEIYLRVHRAITAALDRNGVRAILALSAAPRISDACFANPVRSDVLLDGCKVAGAAQRRSRTGLLQQGSIQLAALPENFIRDFPRAICRSASRTDIAADCLAAACKLAETKYATNAWLTRC